MGDHGEVQSFRGLYAILYRQYTAVAHPRYQGRGDFGGKQSLRESLKAVDLAAVAEVRAVRNKACAHLDSALSLKQIQSLILDLDDSIILERVLNPAVDVLLGAAHEDITTRWLFMDEPSLSGARPASTPGVKAFDRSKPDPAKD